MAIYYDLIMIDSYLIKRRCLKRMLSFFCYAARLLSIFIFKTSLVFSIIPLREVILQK